jgi:signal transduction histidine kinase
VFADLNDIVRNIDKMLRRIVREDINLVTVLSAAELPVMVDVGQMEQVLINLAINACDACLRWGIWGLRRMWSMLKAVMPKHIFLRIRACMRS